MTTLSVSIVVHDSSLERLTATLNSLARAVAHARRSGCLGDVVVALLDNASPAPYANTLQTLLAAFPDADTLSMRLVMHPINAGFGAGHNAAQHGDGSAYRLILNPDVELAPEALGAALDYLAEHDEVVALNPYCEGSDGQREFLCKRYPSVLDLLLRGLPVASLRRRFATRLARYEYRDSDARTPREVCLLSGACLLCRGEHFAALGGFDERYFMYFEDFDLSLRLGRRGRVVFLPAMRIVHHGGYAARKGARHIGWFLRSARRFFSQYGWRLR